MKINAWESENEFDFTILGIIDLYTALANWARRDESGLVFDSSAGFSLPNGAVRSPDVSSVRLSKYATCSFSDEL